MFSFAANIDMRHGLFRIFRRIYGPAFLLAAVLVVIAFTSLSYKAEHNRLVFILMLSLFATLLVRTAQGYMLLLGSYYFKGLYFRMRAAFSILALFHTVFWFILRNEISEMLMVQIYILYADVLCITELLLRDEFRQFTLDNIILESTEFYVLRDSLSRDADAGFDLMMSRSSSAFKRLWARFAAMLKIRRTGAIALSEEEHLGLAASYSVPPASQVPSVVPPEIAAIVEHWAEASKQKHRALWISTDGMSYDSISDQITPVVTALGMNDPVKVDLSEARAVFWPLVHGLVRASVEYKDELGINPPWPIRSQFALFSPYAAMFSSNEPYRASWPDHQRAEVIAGSSCLNPIADYHQKFFLHDIICEPLLQRYQRFERPLACATLIFQGITTVEQVDELYHAICTLDTWPHAIPPALNIIVIVPPQFLYFASDPDRHMMEHICMLYVSENGPTIYSENIPALSECTMPNPPRLVENIFLLLVHSIQWTGGETAERLWNTARDVAQSSREQSFIEPEVDQMNTTDLSCLPQDQILATLYGAYQDRKRILAAFREFPRIPAAYIMRNLGRDNAKIAQYLPFLFDMNVEGIPPEYALAVLNLIDDILYQGLFENGDIVQTPKTLFRPALILLHAFAEQFAQLPDRLTVTGLVLLNDHPLKEGGFSEIYHGNWIFGQSETEVALKVLKKLHNGPGQAELFREALVWSYLNHQNIARFLGVDRVTFKNPALVSWWFPQGSVVKYMTQHTPASSYALEMLCGISSGLEYMHKANVVHGDLCARNILIDEQGRPQLTDFGLTKLVDPENVSSSDAAEPRGSTRWMAPELFENSSPPTTASDIWAFGCVACEIWTEGQKPWSHIDSDMGVISALIKLGERTPSSLESDFRDELSAGPSSRRSDRKHPYLERPVDRQGNQMPSGLWELVRWCWNENSTDRPTGTVVTEMLAEVRAAEATIRHKPMPRVEGNPFFRLDD
ncbi:Kinase-like protein [Mycena sanguinolenta]|uniref:Kinase-like protein n=1 Tax=Mycena sanguinolenta TaxID=230812 RepID=A0A8H6YGX3_9AGAR|nr:Kinase-like protein [Mycena sanguinolenta]